MVYARKPIPEIAAKFWARLIKTETCWLWTGALTGGGYGVLTVQGERMGAHCFAYRLAHGPIPPGMLVMHECDNRRCANPAHLKAGTQLDNMRDMSAKGRHWRQGITHCQHGHEFDSENTYINARGNRACKECARTRKRAAYVIKQQQRNDTTKHPNRAA